MQAKIKKVSRETKAVEGRSGSIEFIFVE